VLAFCFVPLLLAQAPAQEEPKVVALTLRGLAASADYVAVQKQIARVPGVARVVFWVEKDNYHIHVHAKEPLRLRALHEATADAEKEMKETLRMTVDYAIDESRLRLSTETTVVVTGGDAVVEAIKLVVPVASTAPRDGALEVRIAPKEPVAVAALRKSVEGTLEKLLDVALPGGSRPAAAYVCPNGCSESRGEGFCPRCAEKLVKGAGVGGATADAAKPPASGG